jgi:hypothetical protein
VGDGAIVTAMIGKTIAMTATAGKTITEIAMIGETTVGSELNNAVVTVTG